MNAGYPSASAELTSITETHRAIVFDANKDVILSQAVISILKHH